MTFFKIGLSFCSKNMEEVENSLELAEKYVKQAGEWLDRALKYKGVTLASEEGMRMRDRVFGPVLKVGASTGENQVRDVKVLSRKEMENLSDEELERFVKILLK